MANPSPDYWSPKNEEGAAWMMARLLSIGSLAKRNPGCREVSDETALGQPMGNAASKSICREKMDESDVSKLSCNSG